LIVQIRDFTNTSQLEFAKQQPGIDGFDGLARLGMDALDFTDQRIRLQWLLQTCFIH